MNDLAEFFLKLEKQEWSGEVQVTASEGNAFILLEHGRFAYAHRPIDRAAERLSKLDWIKLPPENVLNSCRNWDEFIKHLMTQNVGVADRLRSFLKTDRLELFFRIFFWSNVELTARPAEMDVAGNPNLSFYSKRDLHKLVNEAQTRVKEWPVIQKKIGSSRRVFVSRIPVSDPRRRSENVDAIDSALLHFEGTSQVSGPQSFSDEQILLLSLCNGSNSVQEIVKNSPDGEFLTLRRLIDLWEKGLIAPKEDEGTLQVPELRLLPAWSDWKAALLATLILGLVCLLLKVALLPQASPHTSEALARGLELYRASQGRYPVSLNELAASGLIHGIEVQKYEYRLLNLNEYSLRSLDKNEIR